MKVIAPHGIDGEVSEKEAEIIARLAWQSRGKMGIAVEIGTFQGATTENIAENFDGRVLTVDMPPDDKPKLEFPIDNAKYFNAPKRFAKNPRIEQIFCDSLDLKIDDRVAFAFIDGCHSEEYVISDFGKIEPHAVHGGLVLFHDYRTEYWAGVVAAINKLAAKYPQHLWTYFIGTSLVCCTINRN